MQKSGGINHGINQGWSSVEVRAGGSLGAWLLSKHINHPKVIPNSLGCFMELGNVPSRAGISPRLNKSSLKLDKRPLKFQLFSRFVADL